MKNLIEKVTIYCRPSETNRYEAFIVDSNTNHDTAKYWVRDYSRNKLEDCHIFEQENVFENAIILDIEQRGNGGRAYKTLLVCYNGALIIVDLREDQILHAIQNIGIEKGGYINEKLHLISHGKLVFESSEKYKSIIRGINALKEHKPISTRDLVVGKKYRGSLREGSDDFYIYLGQTYTLPKSIKLYDDEVDEVSKMKPKKTHIFSKTNFADNGAIITSYLTTKPSKLYDLMDGTHENVEQLVDVSKKYNIDLSKSNFMLGDADKLIEVVSKRYEAYIKRNTAVYYPNVSMRIGVDEYKSLIDYFGILI